MYTNSKVVTNAQIYANLKKKIFFLYFAAHLLLLLGDVLHLDGVPGHGHLVVDGDTVVLALVPQDKRNWSQKTVKHTSLERAIVPEKTNYADEQFICEKRSLSSLYVS